MTRALALALLLTLSAGCASFRVTDLGHVSPKDALAIAVYPRFAMKDATVILTWRIDPDPANREYCVEVEGWRTFCDDKFPQRIYQQYLDGIPAGNYNVKLKITRSDGQLRVAQTSVCVSGDGFSCVSTDEDSGAAPGGTGSQGSGGAGDSPSGPQHPH